LPANGLLALSLADPVNPTVVGQYTIGGYCHDFEIYKFTAGPNAGKTIAFACMGPNGIDIVDYTNIANPVRISRTTYTNVAYCHQAWYEPTSGLLYLNDELDESNIPGVTPCMTRIFDVSDLAAPQLVSTFHIPNTVIDHNNYIRNGFLYQANYRAGLHLFDIRGANAQHPVRVGWFDTYPGADALAFAVHPEELARCGIEGYDRAARADRRVQHAACHEGRAFEIDFGARAKRIGFEAPRDLELAEIVAIDLVQRRVARAGEIAAIGAPLTAWRGYLRRQLVVHARSRKKNEERCEHGDEKTKAHGYHGSLIRNGRVERHPHYAGPEGEVQQPSYG
jgi:hypothetical protein